MVIAVINQKGGVGKSTTAAAVGAGLRRRGLQVLAVDLDAQGNLSYLCGAAQNGVTVLDVLMNGADASAAVQRTEHGDIIAASPSLSGADTIITQVGKEYRLREALAPLLPQYDYIIVDTPPALGILTVNALTACDGVIVPAQADVFSLQGVAQLSGTVSTVRKYCNPKLAILGIVLTRFNARSVLSRDIAATAADTAAQLHTKLFDAKIRECTALKEAQAMCRDIFSYAPKSNAALDYADLVSEIIRAA